MTTASFVAGDTGSKLRVTCKDNTTKNPIDLTATSVELQWRTRKGVLVEKEMTIVNAVSGIAEYKFAASDLEPSVMQFEVEIVDASGNKLRNLNPIIELVREGL